MTPTDAMVDSSRVWCRNAYSSGHQVAAPWRIAWGHKPAVRAVGWIGTCPPTAGARLVCFQSLTPPSLRPRFSRFFPGEMDFELLLLLLWAQIAAPRSVTLLRGPSECTYSIERLRRKVRRAATPNRASEREERWSECELCVLPVVSIRVP